MKRNVLSVCILLTGLLQSSFICAGQENNHLSLSADNFEHIKFSKIQSNRYTFENQQLKIDVDSSASFLMKPFESIEKVKQVSFQWRSVGVPVIEDASQESKRSGDDAVFKIGLLLSGKGSFSSFFMPAWMKQVGALLKHPSEDMIYLVANARHKPNEQWRNPYNDRILMVAVNSVSGEQGWQQSSYQFESPIDVVALWLMADGDNTKSSFTVQIKNISIQ